jgi:hypothetical protein
LSAEEARTDARLNQVWEIVDYVIARDVTVSAAIYGSSPE